MLTLNVSIMRDTNFKFANKGSIKIKCPVCNEPVEINLKGLSDDETLSPCIDWQHEGGTGEEQARFEHFKLVRDSLAYRTYLAVEEMLAQSEPCWVTDEDEPLPVKSSPEPKWSRRQWDYIQQLESKVLFLQKKVLELLASERKKRTSIY